MKSPSLGRGGGGYKKKITHEAAVHSLCACVCVDDDGVDELESTSLCM